MSYKNQTPEEALELSKIFHEIKNPLTLINSSLQLIESEHPEVTSFRFWNQTMEDLKNLRSLILELSTFQKVSALQMQKINLFDFTEELLESASAFLLENGTPLTLECDIDNLDFHADESKLRQAVINLLKNAAESSKPGNSILLQISISGKELLLRVTDHGCGIDEEQLPHLFEPFHTTKSDGSGLGLPIVKRITEAHGGSLSVTSQKGVGTSVQIAIPLS